MHKRKPTSILNSKSVSGDAAGKGKKKEKEPERVESDPPTLNDFATRRQQDIEKMTSKQITETLKQESYLNTYAENTEK